MFLLRCGFWLSLVYAGLLFPGAPFGRPIDQHVTADLTRDVREGIAPNVARRAIDYCQTHAQTCLSSAAQLNALVDVVSRSDESVFLSDSRKPAQTRPAVKPIAAHRGARVAATRVSALER